MATVRWRPTLAPRAREDLSEIIAWTEAQFGPAQAEVYRDVIFAAFRELTEGPALAGIKTRDDILPGLLALHVARHGRRGRHFVLFRAAASGKPILEILRILHDQMDLSRHFMA